MDKIVVLLIALLTLQAQYTEAISIDDYLSYFDESRCADKLNVTLNEVLFFKPSNQSDISPLLDCFSACILEYAGLMRGCSLEDDDSKYNFMEQIPKEWTVASVKECSVNIADLDDECACGLEIGKCIAGMLPEEYIPTK